MEALNGMCEHIRMHTLLLMHVFGQGIPKWATGSIGSCYWSMYSTRFMDQYIDIGIV